MQNPQNHSSEQRFESIALEFLTFLYAAAIHLVVQHSYRFGGPPPQAALAVVLSIAFLFSDWSSRTRLPNLTGDRIAPPVLLLKTSLEICGVYFLVSSFLQLVEHPPVPSPPVALGAIGADSAFGVFLVVTFLWDLFMLGVMQGLKWRDLGESVIYGNAGSKLEYKAYLERLEKWQKSRAKQIAEKYAEIRSAADEGRPFAVLARSVHLNSISLVGSFMGRALSANIAALMQFLANHIAHANLIAGVAILGRDAGWLQLNSSFLQDAVSWWCSVNLLWPVAISILFLFGLVVAAAGWAWGLGSFLVLTVSGLLTALGAFGSLTELVDAVWRTTAFLVFVWTVWTVPYYLLPSGSEGRADAKTSACQLAGGVLVLLTLLLLYALLPARALVVLMAFQQVLANVFLQIWLVTPVTAKQSVAPEQATT